MVSGVQRLASFPAFAAIELEQFTGELAEAAAAIRAGDGDTLRALFTRAKRLRDRYIVEAEQ